ncbi:MAG: hypothetical protein SGI88_14755 [Candidatus Hydrogenedentes bacterium]|nr:hypothetical protein [Candidatus Hydrogenedentota bacterium]
MTTDTLTLSQTVGRYASSRRRRIGALALVRAAWVLIAIVLALVYADVLLQLSGPPRLALLCAGIAGVSLCAALTYCRQARASSEQRLVARLLEQSDATLGNDLVNALEFEEMLYLDAPTRASRPLMREEVRLASGKAAHVTHTETLSPPALHKESYVLAGIAVFMALSVLVFTGVFQAVLPRYLDPFGDHPPYSPTRLLMAPEGLKVDFGSNAEIRAETSGLKPEEVSLILENKDGVVIQELPMARVSDTSFAHTIEHVTSDYVYHARVDRGRSKRHPLSISKLPRIANVNVHFQYPAYTFLPPKTRQLGDPGIIRAYPGTNATLSISSNRPLKKGSFSIDELQASFGPTTDPQTAEGTFTLEGPAQLEARLTDVEGNVGAEVFRARVEVQADEKPEIVITVPGRQSFAIPSAEVPIQIEARDDLGVASITLFRGLNRSGDTPKQVFTSNGGEVLANAVELLDLNDLGVRPGDVIDIYATAVDTLPLTPQTQSTPAHQITIISEEQYRAFQQQETTADDLKEKYDALQSAMDGIASEQKNIEAETRALREALGNAPAANDAIQRQLSELAARQSALAEQTAKAAEQFRQEAAAPAVFDIEKEFKKTLGETAARLERARDLMANSAEQLGQAADAKAASPGQTAGDAAKNQQLALDELGQGKKDYAEKIQKPADEIAKMYKLLEDVETFKAIHGAQSDLERQARSYRDVRSPSLDQHVRLKELGQAQKEIRGAIIDLKSDLAKHAAEIEVELPNVGRDARGIVDGIDGRNIPTVMEQAMGGLSKGDGQSGHEKADEAARLLDQMIERVEQAQGSSSESESRLRITMGLDAGNTMAQMQNSVKPGFMPSPGGMAGNGSQSAAPIDMFGPEGQKGKATEESAMSRTKANANARAAEGVATIAGSLEEIETPQENELNVETGPAEPVVEEYRAIIDAYFERIADEQ